MKTVNWTFITNHAAVLTKLNEDNKLTAREIGRTLNITSRTVYRIIQDLEQEGYLSRSRIGRRNVYTINKHLPMRRKDQRYVEVNKLLAVLSNQNQEGNSGKTPGS